MRSSRHRDDPIGACRPVVHELPALYFHETVVNVHEKSVRGKCDLFLEHPSGHRRVFGRTPPVARLVLPVLSPDVMVYGIEGRGADRRKSPLPYVAFVGERAVRMPRKRDGVGVRLERARGISGIASADVRPEAGALAQTLNIIGAHGYNMRNLRSRPMKDLQWNYYFYVEAEGNINTQNGRDMLHELSAICAKLRLVGTFYVHN